MQQEQLVLPSGVVVRGPNKEQYTVEALLGKGEMGAVYLVKDRHIEGKLFALKEVINPGKHDRERFIFEGDVLKRLHHRALPHVHYIFENDKLKRVYILMDYVKGQNLENLRREQAEGSFSFSLVLALMTPIAEALIYLHRQQPPIIHRDVKTEAPLEIQDAEENGPISLQTRSQKYFPWRQTLFIVTLIVLLVLTVLILNLSTHPFLLR